MAMVRQELLVGRDHWLPAPEGVEDQRASRLDATHHLDDDIAGRVLDDGPGIGGEALELDGHLPGRREISYRDAGHLDPNTGPPGDVFGVLVQHARHGSTDLPAPQQPHAHRLAHEAAILASGVNTPVPRSIEPGRSAA